jgi:hypothetical protein
MAQKTTIFHNKKQWNMSQNHIKARVGRWNEYFKELEEELGERG